MAIWSQHTRVSAVFHIWAATRHFPAIGKIQWIAHWQLALSGEVIWSIAIKISTQATHFSLHSQIETVGCCFHVRADACQAHNV